MCEREFVGKVGSAYTLVTLGRRRNRLRKSLRHRINCIFCGGSVSSDGFCSHCRATCAHLCSVCNDYKAYNDLFMGMGSNLSVDLITLEP